MLLRRHSYELDQSILVHSHKRLVNFVCPSPCLFSFPAADITAKCLCLGVEGVAWLIDTRGSIWFTGNVTRENPTGETWYQVSLGQYLMHDPTLPPLLVSTLTTLSSLWSWVKRGDEGRMLAASPRAGVWLLGRNGSLQASHGHLLGSRWEHVAPAGIAQSVFWSYVSANGYKDGKGHMWALQPNGELVCFHPADGRTVPVNSPQGALLKLVAASSQGVWGITHKYKVVQRLGITASCPEGYDWVDLNLHQFGIGRVRHLSCGVLTTWAVDDRGKMWVRIGSREETDPSVTQAWLHVEGNALSECHFTSVAVSGGDLVVWAVDDRSNVYARKDVTPSYPIGTAWELVPGMCVRDLSISEHMVWATCPNGDVACRYGVSEHNAIGDYWKKVPGNFELISVTPDDELWAINRDGQLFCRKTQHFYGTQSPFKARTYSTLFAGEEEWEFI